MADFLKNPHTGLPESSTLVLRFGGSWDFFEVGVAGACMLGNVLPTQLRFRLGQMCGVPFLQSMYGVFKPYFRNGNVPES